MAVLLWSYATVTLAFLLHLIWWRIRIPKYQTRTLLFVFFGVLAAALMGLALAARLLRPTAAPLPAGISEYVQIALFVIAFTLAYVITYSALEADSPSLVMIRAVAHAGAAGLRQAEFHAWLSDDRLVTPRIQDLIRDHLVILDGDRYRLTAKGRRFIAIFILFRALLGAGKGG